MKPPGGEELHIERVAGLLVVQEVQDQVRKPEATPAAPNGPILRFLSGAFVTAGGVAAARSRKATRAVAGQVLSSLRGSSNSMIWVCLCVYCMSHFAESYFCYRNYEHTVTAMTYPFVSCFESCPSQANQVQLRCRPWLGLAVWPAALWKWGTSAAWLSWWWMIRRLP